MGMMEMISVFVIAILSMVSASFFLFFTLNIVFNNYYRSKLAELRLKYNSLKTTTYLRTKKEYKEQANKELAWRIENLRQSFLFDNTHLIAQALCSSSAVQLQKNLNELLEKQFNRMSQEFVGQLIDDSDIVKTNFILEIGDRIWDRLQQIKEKLKDSPYVLPEGCKVAYTKGNRTIVIIEQKPQVRSVFIGSSLVSESIRNQAQSNNGNIYRFSLSFPYVLFFVVFDRGKYRYHEVYFRNKPLLSTREYVYLAPMPNVHNLKSTQKYNPVCMGSRFYDNINKGNTLAHQCEIVVNTFWQSAFNSDLGDGNTRNVDKRIKNWAVWQKNTLENPLFILEVQWKKGKTVKGAIEMVLDKRDYKHELDGIDKEIKDQIDAGIGKISHNVKQAIEAAQSYKIKNIDKLMQQNLESLLIEHTDKVFKKCSTV